MRLYLKVGILMVAIGCAIVLSAIGLSKYSIEKTIIYSEKDFEKNNSYYFSKTFNLSNGEVVKISWNSTDTIIEIVFKEEENFTLLKYENSTKGNLQYNVKNSGEYFLIAKTNSSLRVGISLIITSYPFADIVFPMISSGLGVVGVGTVFVLFGFHKRENY